MFSKSNAIFGAVIVVATMAATGPTLALPVNDGAMNSGDVTSNVIFGSGNGNGNWTGVTENNVEIGLRGKVPKQGVYNYNGVDTYNFDTGLMVGSTYRPAWNFEWAINVNKDGLTNNSRHIDNLTYTLSLDSDHTSGTNFIGSTFDPIRVPYADHSFGNNGTAQGQGAEALKDDTVQYASLLAGNNIVQQSWSYGFFLALLPGFDRDIAGIYTVMLSVSDINGELASTSMNIIVGDVSTIPVPAALPLFGTGLAIMGFFGWRRRKVSAKT